MGKAIPPDRIRRLLIWPIRAGQIVALLLSATGPIYWIVCLLLVITHPDAPNRRDGLLFGPSPVMSPDWRLPISAWCAGLVVSLAVTSWLVLLLRRKWMDSFVKKKVSTFSRGNVMLWYMVITLTMLLLAVAPAVVGLVLFLLGGGLGFLALIVAGTLALQFYCFPTQKELYAFAERIRGDRNQQEFYQLSGQLSPTVAPPELRE